MSRKQSSLMVQIDAIKREMQRVTKNTFIQYMTDTACITLNDMGWGKDRIDSFLTKWGQTYDEFFPALQNEAETDYYRAKLDERCKAINKPPEWKSFEERYEYLPEMRY